MSRNSKREMKNTENSRVYKIAKWEHEGSCPLCPPNKGCNRNRYGDNSWKKHRKRQWRE